MAKEISNDLSEGNSRPGWRPGKYCHLRELYDPFTPVGTR
ncbi:Uncharacterised protein [Salmonella enterica subsp. arizonae]|uniref:Uncharacterized protein n=1 Tax=Salmonella enterica subsp. arizonae TaxID=59203 RepID=A0A379T7L3_SALER|nr:Uncharacterised protein [Salmonella enterica subsp. arizonae]